MIDNLVLLRVKEECQGRIPWVKDRLATLQEGVPELRQMKIEVGDRRSPNSYDLLYTASFDDPEDFEAYLQHSYHRAISMEIQPVIEAIASIYLPDREIGGQEPFTRSLL